MDFYYIWIKTSDMKLRILLVLAFLSLGSYAQELWRPLGSDEFNRAARGTATPVGRSPIVIKNGHIFLLNMEKPYLTSGVSHLSMSRYNGSYWEHFGFPFFSAANLNVEFAVGNDEMPYVVIQDQNGINVKKLEYGNWVNVGPTITTAPNSQSDVNIKVGSDNLPRILFFENGILKLKIFDGSDWTSLSETTEFSPNIDITLELDNTNIPYILTNSGSGTNYYCFVRKLNGNSWQEVGITGFTSKGLSLVFDSSNTPYMICGNIKKFNGTEWETAALPPITSSSYNYSKIEFNTANELFAGFSQTFANTLPTHNIKKLTNGSWQTLFAQGTMYDSILFAVSGNNAYHVSNQFTDVPQVAKLEAGQSPVTLGETNNTPTSNMNSQGTPFTHDFKIINDIPMVAYFSNNKASLRKLDGYWQNVGETVISENNVNRVYVRSAPNGEVYIIYNNQITSPASDVRLTVKKFTQSGWMPVGPINFSLTAGDYFDLKFNSLNVPYVVYANGRVQKYDGTNWVFVGGSLFTGEANAKLAFDANDVPYISCKGVVKRFNGTDWEFVDQAGLTGIYVSGLISSASNTLFLFYSKDNKIYIKKLNGGFWEAVGPGMEYPAAMNYSIYYDVNIDHNDVPYIAYSYVEDNFRSLLNVKKFNGTDWEYVGAPKFSSTNILQAAIDFSANNTPMVAYSSLFRTVNVQLRYFGTSNPLGIEELPLEAEKLKLTLSPNPATSRIEVSGDATIKEIAVFNLLGQQLLRIQENDQIDISSLQKSVYVARIKTDRGIQSIKFIKE